LLLQAARSAIEERLFGVNRQKGGGADVPPKLREPRGCFVTLVKDGLLRGCIGNIVPKDPLIESVRQNALNAAFDDPRFPPLDKEDWASTRVEVSVLTVPVPLEYDDGEDLVRRLRPGKDGVIIKKGSNQATFLPQVWNQLPDPEKFLSQLCLKAGLPAGEWRRGNIQVSTYGARAYGEE